MSGLNSTLSTAVLRPPSVPDAPTIGAATRGNVQASIAFSAPAYDGGSAITGYTVTSTPGSFTASGAGSPLVVTGLTNGTAYTFTAHATNAIGNSAESAASNSVTPATIPGAPTIGTATKGNTNASVAFSAPASNGGDAITGYTATSSPGGFTGTGASSPITVSGLTNGTAYTFTVTATNTVGTGSASAASNSCTPSTVPDAPTIGTATKGNAQVSVAFTGNGTGGDALTSPEYTATSTPGSFTGTGASSPIVVTGLANGTAYTFKVKAHNSNGYGSESAASNSATPSTVPDAPTIGTATAGDTTASVTFTDNGTGGSAITGHTVTSSPGSHTGTGSSPVTVTGLTNGTAYTFTVKATNANGDSSASSASNSVTPAAAPVYATWNPADASANVTLSGGNLVATWGSTTAGLVRSTIGKSTGKWYWEVTPSVSNNGPVTGVATSAPATTRWCGQDTTSWGYYGINGNVYNNGGVVATFGGYGVSNVIGHALDVDAGTLDFYVNNVHQGQITGLSGTLFACHSLSGNTALPVGTANFGATALAYSPPAGYNAGLYS